VQDVRKIRILKLKRTTPRIFVYADVGVVIGRKGDMPEPGGSGRSH